MSRPSPVAVLALMALSCNPDQEIIALQPTLTVSPGAIDFGEVVVDYTLPLTLEVINSGKADLEITDVQVLDTTLPVFSHDGVPTTLAPDDRVVVMVTCTPSTYTTYANTLQITSNDPDFPEYQVPITCTGIKAPTPDIEVEPTLLEYGECMVEGETCTCTDAVEPSEIDTQWFTIRNLGDGDLTILSMVQEGSGQFTEFSSNATGVTVSPGNDEFMVVVGYSPLQATGWEGDVGTFTITTNDPDEPVTTVNLLGNCGGDYQYPVAQILTDQETYEPLDTVKVDGGSSYDPNGQSLTYAWSLVDAPTGSTVDFSSVSGRESSLFLDLAGDYTLQLVVRNEDNAPSAPARKIVQAIPSEDLRVEMFWDTANTDMDLHLVQEGYAFFQEPYDCCYCNPNPDWSDSSDIDDPRLDLDDRSGYGPENINIDTPADGEYEVYVHYFNDNTGSTSGTITTASVKVYLDKVMEWTGSMPMSHNDVWHVGTIHWPERTFELDETAVPYSAGDTRGCWEE